jgi:hypothetical protein
VYPLGPFSFPVSLRTRPRADFGRRLRLLSAALPTLRAGQDVLPSRSSNPSPTRSSCEATPSRHAPMRLSSALSGETTAAPTPIVPCPYPHTMLLELLPHITPPSSSTILPLMPLESPRPVGCRPSADDPIDDYHDLQAACDQHLHECLDSLRQQHDVLWILKMAFLRVRACRRHKPHTVPVDDVYAYQTSFGLASGQVLHRSQGPFSPQV